MIWVVQKHGWHCLQTVGLHCSLPLVAPPGGPGWLCEQCSKHSEQFLASQQFWYHLLPFLCLAEYHPLLQVKMHDYVKNLTNNLTDGRWEIYSINTSKNRTSSKIRSSMICQRIAKQDLILMYPVKLHQNLTNGSREIVWTKYI